MLWVRRGKDAHALTAAVIGLLGGALARWASRAGVWGALFVAYAVGTG